jgi:hypothetical protein
MKLIDNNRIVFLRNEEILRDCFKVTENNHMVNVEFKYELNAGYWGSTSITLYNITLADIETMESKIKEKYTKYKFAKKKDKDVYLTLLNDFNAFHREAICALDLHYNQFATAKERDYSNDTYWHKELFLSIGQMSGIINTLKYPHYRNTKLSEAIDYICRIISDSQF